MSILKAVALKAVMDVEACVIHPFPDKHLPQAVSA
jgi:hypothetical protein